MSDKGSRSIYVDRFWGQVLRKYLQGTQGRPELCFGGFGLDEAHSSVRLRCIAVVLPFVALGFGEERLAW